MSEHSAVPSSDNTELIEERTNSTSNRSFRQPDAGPLNPPLGFRSNAGPLGLVIRTWQAGIVELPRMARALVSIHVGRTVQIASRHGNKRRAGLAVHGDIEIVPPGVATRWESKEATTSFLIGIAPQLLEQVAKDTGFEDGGSELQDRFQIRDPHIERIGWALIEEVEQGYPSGDIYLESMAVALAVRLVRNHSLAASQQLLSKSGLSRSRLRLVLSYIEDNLNNELPLQAIAAVAGISVSYLKALFRRSVGVPVHQYVIRRRVERAALLLRQSSLPISQIALETGFAHQSHLAMHIRRVLGVAPKDISKLPESA